MDKIQTNEYDIKFNTIDHPCEEFKTKLSMCMKNSDDNIVACQSLRDIYENCIREENKRSR